MSNFGLSALEEAAIERVATWSVPFPVDTNLRWIIPTKEQCS